MESDSFPGTPIPPPVHFFSFPCSFSATGHSVGKLCDSPLRANIMAATRTDNHISPLRFSEIVNRHCTAHDIQIDFSTKRFRVCLLPPATKLGQRYVFTRVCDSVHRGGVCPITCWDTHTPLPWVSEAGTPPRIRGRHPPSGTRPHPSAVHAGRYRQQAGGTHPTGMHSCFICFQYVLIKHSLDSWNAFCTFGKRNEWYVWN